MVAQFTGGTPAETGVYYDSTYNHALLPAGTTDCKNAKPGAAVDFTEDLDLNKANIDAGQGLSGLPNSILSMTGNPVSLINPAALPVDPATCKPVYPSQYLKVNTVFDIAHAAGLRTAWSDKHPAYSILDGKSGNSIDDLFTPEINSNAIGYAAGNDWTTDNAATKQYDNYKVEAVLNEIDGYDHSGTSKVGVPAIFGLNFQTVSTAEKLPTSDGKTGGYLANGTPGPLLSSALSFVNNEVAQFVNEIHKQGLASSTTIILSAKHGQSPIQGSALTRIPDSPILSALNAAWAKAHPAFSGDLVALATDDDAMLLWLNDRSAGAVNFVKNFLTSYSGTGNDINDKPKAYTSSGLSAVYAGWQYFGAKKGDPRVPDVVGVAKYGTVFTGGTGKIAEHGGASANDRDVPLVVSGAGVAGYANGSVVTSQVYTTEIAPTMLRLLGLNPSALQAVRDQHTPVLPLL
jgi:hypothetical protein